MPRINNKKLLCREAGEEYTAAEYFFNYQIRTWIESIQRSQ